MRLSLRDGRGGRARPLIVTIALVAGLLPAALVQPARAGITVLAATGGESIKADTAANAPSPSWTSLLGPVITEDQAGQLAKGGTIALRAPSGFQFNSQVNSGATVTVIRGGPNCDGLTFDPVTVTSSQINVRVAEQSTSPCQVTFDGIQVQPIVGTPLLSGTITNVGTTAPGGATNYGTLTMVPGDPAKLAFVQQPSSAPANVAFLTQPKVAVQDLVGNTITADNTTQVTLSITPQTPTVGGNGAVLSCNGGQAATVSSGVASFSGCRISVTGLGYRLRAADTSPPGSGHPYTAADSARFDIPDNLGFEVQPGGGGGSGGKAQGGLPFANQPKVTVRLGTAKFTTAKAVNDSTTLVTLAIRPGTGAAGATLTCDQANNTARVTAGSAQFSGCRIDKAGTGYQLVATSLPAFGANAWYSTAFDVVAGPATKLAFLQQPGGASAGIPFTTQPVVAVTDAGGNLVTSGVSANVTLTVGANPGNPPGVLSCVPSNTVAIQTSGPNAGKAIFSGCRISTAGVGYTLTALATGVTCASGACATPGSLLPATSQPFTVGLPPAQISLTSTASVIVWGSGITLSVTFGANGANKTFTLEGARDGVTWSPIATLTTDAAGRAGVAYRPRTNLFYRAVFAGSSDLAAGTSNTVRVVVRQKILLRPTTSGVFAVPLGSTSQMYGLVRPIGAPLPPAKVTFEFWKLMGGDWVRVTTREAYVDSGGYARLGFRWLSRGEWRVRAWANPTPYNANSIPSPFERYSVR